MAPPHGAFLVLYEDGKPAGCAGLKTIAPGIGELKRMWVAPGRRGRGHAGRLLEAVEEAARELGHQRLRLDTWADMGPAHRLYRAAGFRDITPYNRNPFAAHWMEKPLSR